MWHQHPQHIIGATESGKPIHFHYSEGEDGARYTPRDHHEAATLHDRARNRDAQMASLYESQGLKAAANGYKQRAVHHGQQATKHMAKVLPAAQKEPKIQPAPKVAPETARPTPAYVTAQSLYQKKKN